MSTLLAEALRGLPEPSQRAVTVRVTPSAARELRRGHPWLFDGGVEQVNHPGLPGDVALLYDASRRKKMLGVGLYDPDSPIRVKVLHAGGPLTVDAALFAQRIDDAIARREPLVERGDTDGYRVVYGEADALPGVVADRYAGTLVVKLYSAMWWPWLGAVLEPLVERMAPERVVLRLARTLQDGGAPLRDGDVVMGPALDGAVLFREHGLRFESDPIRGQKTGFFLDQRDNRARVESLAGDKRVLNVFSYTGGFSVYAARGGARSVTDVDLNPHAIAACARNMALNADVPAVAACDHEALQGDAFEVLADLAAARRAFDVVVVDPPSFARQQKHVDRALAAYARLVELSLPVLAPGGTLVLASCSSRVTAEAFRDNALAAARRAGQPLEIEVETGHAIDHPVPAGFPEGAYLKCLFTHVSDERL